MDNELKLEKGKFYEYDVIKKIFEKAEHDALEELDKKMKKNDTENKMDGMGSFVFSLQNMLAMSVLKKFLFEKEETNE